MVRWKGADYTTFCTNMVFSMPMCVCSCQEEEEEEEEEEEAEDQKSEAMEWGCVIVVSYVYMNM